MFLKQAGALLDRSPRFFHIPVVSGGIYLNLFELADFSGVWFGLDPAGDEGQPKAVMQDGKPDERRNADPSEGSPSPTESGLI